MAAFIALVLIVVASIYIYHRPKALDPNLQAKFEKGNYAQGIPNLEAWLADNPNDLNAKEALAAFYMQKAGMEPAAAKDILAKARNLLGTIVKADPQRDESYRLLGVSYLMADNIKFATENFEKSIRSSGGKNIGAVVGLGMTYEYSKDWKKASSVYATALSKDPKNEDATLGMARYYISVNNTKKAIASAWAVIDVSTNNASLGEAYSILGASMIMIKQPDISIGYFEKSISYRPNNVHALVLLGESYIGIYPLAKAEDRQSTISKMLGAANKAIALDPLYVHAQTLLYKILLLQNKYDEANAVGQKIVSLLPIDKTLTDEQKAEYKKFYGGKISDVKITSVKVIDPNASTGSSSAKAASPSAKAPAPIKK